MTDYISCVETASIIRKELRKHFPGIKFSVRSRTYAGGASIDVSWLDGPSEPSVNKIVKRFQGSIFDSSIDLRSYVDSEYEGRKVHFGADYVMCSHKVSYTFVESIVKQFCQEWGKDPQSIKIKGDEKGAWIGNTMDYSQEQWLKELLYETDAEDMHRAYEAQEERKQREEAEWEAGADERERQAEQDEQEERQREEARRQREAEQRQRQEQARQERRVQGRWNREQQKILASKELTFSFLGLSARDTPDRAAIMAAFRAKAKKVHNGYGEYDEDMDFVVGVKDKALSWI